MPNQSQAEAALADQTNILPFAKLRIVHATLAMAFFIAYADQNGVGVALPTIGKDLSAEDTIAWAGTSSLIANTVFQVLYGRLSDIFGRKNIYLSTIALLAVGEFLCATAQSAPALYVFRGLTGIATGGINSLTMAIVSDVVTLQKRGYYQGILGSFLGLGNIVGPFLSAAFIQHNSWRDFFFLIGPLAVVSGALSIFLLPPSPAKGNAWEKIKLIDWWGLLAGSIVTIFVLIPISGGGSYFPWASPMVISMLAVSGVAGIAFLLIEWRVARLPLMPRQSLGSSI